MLRSLPNFNAHIPLTRKMLSKIPGIILLAFMISLSFPISAVHIEENGTWIGKDAAIQHCFDAPLANALVDFLHKEKAETVVDFGCGLGDYLKCLLANGIQAIGFDGNPYTVELTGGRARVLDLSIPFDLKKQFDWVISLEVGEHLPAEYETIFIENLIRHTKNGLILSWAVEGQRGFGHFNCRNNNYIKARLASYGFYNDLAAEKKLRNRSSLPWFKNTIMVFRKN